MTSPSTSQKRCEVKRGIRKGNNARLVAATVQTVGSTCCVNIIALEVLIRGCSLCMV